MKKLTLARGIVYLCLLNASSSFSQTDSSFSNKSFLPKVPGPEELMKQQTAKPSVPAIVIKAQLDKYFTLRIIDPTAAEKLLQEILKEDPTNVLANKEMGYILLQKKALKTARIYFDAALAADPDDDSTAKQIIQINKILHDRGSSIEITKMEPVNNITVNPMDSYYNLKKTAPEKAYLLLTEILKNKPSDPVLNTEAGYYWLNKKNEKEALYYFKEVLKVEPNNKLVQGQINYLIKKPSIETAAKPLSYKDQLFNKYYALKKTNPRAGSLLLKQIIRLYPKDLNANKEMAYSLLKENKKQEALKYFCRVERITPNDYDIKMQIGYILAELKHSRAAYHAFSLATKSTDPSLNLKANQAMTNLGGLQTKVLPEPWFADLYLSPLYFSRFNLMVYPLQARVGRYFGDKKQGEIYFINRTTKDNRSDGVNNQLPQIFEDNVSIFSVGARYTPFENKVPGLRLYAEGGKAYDLIQREPNRRWRNDFRGGVLYGAIWGAPHEYVEKPTFPFKPIGSIYGDISYFTRYNDNVIGYGSIRQGLRVAEYKTSEINLYLRGRGGFDKNQEFYNNFVEIGPGIELMPNNRYNFSLRLEALKGYYIKVSSPSPNPYGPNYYNTLAIAEFYALF